MPEQQENLIKSHLFRQIQQEIPSTNDHLQSIILIHSRDGDGGGYKALYSIIFRCTTLLDRYQSRFGPKWESNQDPTSYAKVLLTETDIQKMKSGIEYTNAEKSLEMLNRAVEANHKKMTATNFIQLIHKWDNERSNANENLPYQYKVSNLTNALEKSNESNDGKQIERTIINTIRRNSLSNNQNRTTNAGKGRYSKEKLDSPAGKIQCKVCHRFGHNMGFEGKPCNFCAQLYLTTNFMNNAENESEIKKNAELYHSAQQPLIAKVSADAFKDDPTADEETIENHSINLVAVNFNSK